MSITNQSKRLSWLLRHGADESGLAMDAAGWAAVADVLGLTRMSRAALDAVVSENNKRRLELRDDRVRCVQGHSTAGTPVTAEALEASWAAWTHDGMLWHGTTCEAVAGIAARGILPQARTHVHLAAAVDSQVGKRAQVAVLLGIDATILRAATGVFESPNGVVLARFVPVDAITRLRPCTRAAEDQEPALRGLFSGSSVMQAPG